MLIRVVFAATIAATAFPATAQITLPYDIDNFFQPVVRAPASRAENLLPPSISQAAPSTIDARPARTQPSPEIAYDLGDMYFDRVPDHLALAYRLDGLTDYTPQYRNGRDIDPLRYEIKGLLYANYAALDLAERSNTAASP